MSSCSRLTRLSNPGAPLTIGTSSSGIMSKEQLSMEVWLLAASITDSSAAVRLVKAADGIVESNAVRLVTVTFPSTHST